MASRPSQPHTVNKAGCWEDVWWEESSWNRQLYRGLKAPVTFPNLSLPGKEPVTKQPLPTLFALPPFPFSAREHCYITLYGVCLSIIIIWSFPFSFKSLWHIIVSLAPRFFFTENQAVFSPSFFHASYIHSLFSETHPGETPMLYLSQQLFYRRE